MSGGSFTKLQELEEMDQESRKNLKEAFKNQGHHGGGLKEKLIPDYVCKSLVGLLRDLEDPGTEEGVV